MLMDHGFSMLSFCLIVVLTVNAVDAQFSIPMQDLTDCTAFIQYFDFGILSCRTCGSNISRDNTGYSCTCNPGFILDIANPRVISCTACSSSTTTEDGYYCTNCVDGASVVDSQCSCSPNEQLGVSLNGSSANTVEVSCEPCQPGTFVSTGSCAPCPECCPEGLVVDNLCFDSTVGRELVDKSAVSEVIPNSLFIENNLRGAFGACQSQISLRNQTACEQLSNMCVMEHYSQNSDACKDYQRINAGNFEIADSETWSQRGIPWLYFEADTQIDTDTEIPTIFRFQANSKLDFVVAKYWANGSFLGISNVENGLIQLCKDKPSVMNAAYAYGTTFRSTCFLDATTLWNDDNNANVYFDMFLRYTDESNNIMLYPIPVLVSNNPIEDQYVRRFFLIDNIYGITSTSPQASSVRYASSMAIEISIQPTDTGRIYPPILKMSYSSISSDVLTETTPQASVSFSVTYSSDTFNQNEALKITLSTFGVLAFLYAAVEASGWRRRQGLQYVEFTTILQFLLYLVGNLANVFFVVILGYTSVTLIFFKRQDVVTSYVPSDYQEHLFTIFVSLAFSFKCIQIIAMILQQGSIDIFFIDWEKPRAKSVNDGSNKISIWRTYFIANEWNEIQTCRKTNTTFQLFAVLLFLEVIGFKNLALLNSSSDLNPSSDTYTPEYSPLLRFAIGGMVYLIIGIIQVIYFKLIHERFFMHPIRDFVDLCPVSNVSIFILSQLNYGYYIHGRSVSGKADTDMEEMNLMLKREEENRVSQRGLLAGSDEQVFEIMIPARLRQQYDKIYQPLQLMRSQPAARAGNTPVGGVVSESMKAYTTMKTFLTSFIDHALRDLDYIVKEKLFLEKVVGIPLQEAIDSKAFFIIDEAYSFADVLFYGNEAALLIFDILLFSIVDFGSTDFILAAFITYFIGGVIVNTLLKNPLHQVLNSYKYAGIKSIPTASWEIQPGEEDLDRQTIPHIS